MYRSRLQKAEEKNNIKKAIWLFAGAIAILVVLVFWGIPLLVRLVVVIGDIKGGQGTDKTDFIPPAPPRLLVPFEATNSRTINVSGRSEPGATVFLTLNKDAEGSVVVKEDGNFEFGSVSLAEGKNDLIAVAVDASGNKSQSSETLSIYYSNKEPKLEITSPTDRQVVTGQNDKIEIKGQTDPNNRVIVNDRWVVLGTDGKFSYLYKLTSGENNLVITSTDRTGNMAKKELVVVYNP